MKRPLNGSQLIAFLTMILVLIEYPVSSYWLGINWQKHKPRPSSDHEFRLARPRMRCELHSLATSGHMVGMLEEWLDKTSQDDPSGASSPSLKFVAGSLSGDAFRTEIVTTTRLLSASSAMLSQNGALILSAVLEGTVRLWDVQSGRLIRVFKGHTNVVWSTEFSRDKHNILSASSD